MSAVNIVEFVSDKLSSIVLGGRWRNIIVVNLPGGKETTGET